MKLRKFEKVVTSLRSRQADPHAKGSSGKFFKESKKCLLSDGMNNRPQEANCSA